jgi:hypothetical protein
VRNSLGVAVVGRQFLRKRVPHRGVLAFPRQRAPAYSKGRRTP